MSPGEKAIIEAFFRQEIDIMNHELESSKDIGSNSGRIEDITEEDLIKMYGERPKDFDEAQYVESSGSFINDFK